MTALSDEREILRRWDAGESVQRIAREMGKRRRNVAKIVADFHLDGREERAAQADAVRGSALLAQAIAASGGRFA